MTQLPPDVQQAVDRARARANDDLLTLQRTYGDETFQFQFYAGLSVPAMDIIARMSELARSDDESRVSEQLKATGEFLDVMATPQTVALIEALTTGTPAVMSMADVMELHQAVVEAATGRPTTPSQSSAAGSSNNGETSTGRSPSEALTPPGFPSIGS